MKGLSLWLLAINAIAIALYSPNYLSMFHPWIKLIPVLVLVLNVIYILNNGFSYDDLKRQNLLFVFGVILFIVSLVSYQRFQILESVSFSVSFNLKVLQIISCYLIISTKEHLVFFIKVFLGILVAISLHSLLQSGLFSFGFVRPHAVVETQGYIYQYMGLWGFYRVSAEFGGIPVLRAQSFFQEPGFLAFYFCIGLFLLRYLEGEIKGKLYFFISLVLISGVVVTFSFTGLMVLLFYFLTIRGMRLFKMLSVLAGICMAIFILTNPNEYMSKSGSLELRINDFLSIVKLLIDHLYFITGMGFGTEFLFTESRVNNFVFELFLYSSFLGLLVLSLYYYQLCRNLRYSSLIPVNVALFFSLSTPMFWSPVVILCFVISDKYNRYFLEDS
jgi:hypothetical protein